MAFVEIKEQAEKAWDALQTGGKPLISVGTATCGRSAGAMAVLQSFEEELKKRKVEANVVEVGWLPLSDIKLSL